MLTTLGIAAILLSSCGEEACPVGTELTGDELPCDCYGETVEALPGDGSICTCTSSGLSCEQPDTDDTGTDDTGTDDTGSPDTGEPCGPDGICDLTVEEVEVGCGEGSTSASPELTVESAGEGSVRAVLEHAQVGCCPEIEASATASTGSQEIEAEYTLSNDVCQCVCSLDVAMELSGIPSGTWTFLVDEESAEVEVP